MSRRISWGAVTAIAIAASLSLVHLGAAQAQEPSQVTGLAAAQGEGS